MTRRNFVQAAVAAGALPQLRAANAAEIKIGLYSITYGGVWYRGDALTVEQVIGRAKKFGYQGVEIDGKRPHGNPLDNPKARCQRCGSWRRTRGSRSTRSRGTTTFRALSRSIARRSWCISAS